MIDVRISAIIVSGYILLILASPLRWFHHGWRELAYPSLVIQARVETELEPINKLLKILTLLMILHCFYAAVLHPMSVRLREKEQMEREREWREEQLRQVALLQREERDREPKGTKTGTKKRD